MISRRDEIMDIIERFTAFLLQLTGLRAMGEYEVALEQLDTYLAELVGIPGPDQKQIFHHLENDALDPQVLYILPVLLKERTILLFHLYRSQEANVWFRLLLSTIARHRPDLDSDRVKKTLAELCRDTKAAQLDTTSFSALLPVLSEYALYAKADDLIFEYPGIQEDGNARNSARTFYEQLLAQEESALVNGNFSHGEAQESMETLRLDKI
jgi:hypothetical protein